MDSKANLSNKLTHQKGHHSNLKDLKRTIIIDSFGNNNLNVPRKKMKSNITKMNRFLIDFIPQATEPNANNNSSLFEQSTSTHKEGDDSRDLNATMPNFIIFDEKQRSEIDAISFLPNEEEEEEEKDEEEGKVLDTSVIDIDEGLEKEEDSKNPSISLEEK